MGWYWGIGARPLPSLQVAVESTWHSSSGISSKVRRRLSRKTKFCLRENARDDLERLAAVYGSDLASADIDALPADWLVPAYARQLLDYCMDLRTLCLQGPARLTITGMIRNVTQPCSEATKQLIERFTTVSIHVCLVRPATFYFGVKEIT